MGWLLYYLLLVGAGGFSVPVVALVIRYVAPEVIVLIHLYRPITSIIAITCLYSHDRCVRYIMFKAAYYRLHEYRHDVQLQ